MKLIIVTGLCASGKTFFCKQHPNIPYDNIYHYPTCKLDYNKIDSYLVKYSDCSELYLDAYNSDLIDYLRPKVGEIEAVLLYTDIDSYYDLMAITEPRNFCPNGKYTDYVNNIISSITNIHDNLLKYNIKITYKYRKLNAYIDYDNSNHMFSLLQESMTGRLLRFVDTTSGAKDYQSIILDNQYIRRGSEQDWISFDNILKCTSLKDKVICDTGCFNGYFSFRCLMDGAKEVIGVDHNTAAINISNKIAVYNGYHIWNGGRRSGQQISFHEKKIGRDIIFDKSVDLVLALNYLHHLKNELGEQVFLDVVDSFFKNSKEVIFEINDNEVSIITKIALANNFTLVKRIESHRRTSFGNRHIVYFSL